MNEELLRRSYERLLVIREHEDPDRDRCPSVDDIHSLVKREGDEFTRLHRLDHVMQCPDCRREFDLLRSVELARPRTQPGSWRLWAFAATVILVAGLTLVWRMILVNPRVDVLRGDSSRLELVSPAEGTTIQLPETLAWHPVAGALSYQVELIDESGVALWSSEVTDTTLLLESMPVGAVAGWKVVAKFLNGIPLESPTRKLRLENQP